ncbi:hypothetical protein [Sulfurospirillum cavolei]|uniref:hypothetical protein n=1 Tax=Sulfurospirillum cavolei TaxID=366522 RepID=UPI003FA2C7D8
MKQISKVISIFITVLFLIGCSSNENIVKNGTLAFDKSITVGQAFDKYSYFSSTKWRSFKTDNGRQIVEVRGEFTDKFLKLKELVWGTEYNKAVLVVQFKINKDDTFEILAIGFDVTLKNGEKEFVDMGKNLTKGQLNLLLKELYSGEPLS